MFDIVEGPVVKISSIDFKFVGGNDSGIGSGRLREQLTISRTKLFGLIGGDYNPSQIDYDVMRITEYYHGLGFLDAKVNRELTPSPDHDRVQVTFFIEEGKRYKVGRVQITGNTTFGEKKLLEYTDLRENSYYDRKTISGDLRRIRDLYGYTGRAVGVREEHPEPEHGNGVVHVHYEVMEAPQSRVGEIIIQGNTVTQDRIIRRELPLYPGQILSYPDLLSPRTISRGWASSRKNRQRHRTAGRSSRWPRPTRRSRTFWLMSRRPRLAVFCSVLASTPMRASPVASC